MTGLLRRLAAQARERRPSPRAQACGLCGEALPDVHRHLLELPSRELRCACRACQVLFDHAAAGGPASGGRHVLVPDRRRRMSGFVLPDPVWARLGVPVRMACLVRDSASGGIVAFYPSPAGAVRAPADQAAWDLIVRDNPVLAELRQDVEALLVDRDRGAWMVPLDDCYALAGTIRARWRGLTGGQEVRAHLDTFFTDLDDRSVTVPATDDSRSPA
ncbi:hypothetical protein FE391_28615 [Nonomuraea sp. KC401]|uniref:DUF5947 family protein n=1 Tax=unclassified Nonomuraea TaxID=2593643 RepID=UPI0010FF4976|nr:DUF5947 family protein [Nonomuraea sp. KC401]NBE97717.1 hypothetical protein [Nonomuraea sp. K271]TLF63827.1 hypothetical protein FE391_28615 [Nonomuraea sp. KC401]